MEKSGIKNIEKVLQELKEGLYRIYGERFLKLILNIQKEGIAIWMR